MLITPRSLRLSTGGNANDSMHKIGHSLSIYVFLLLSVGR